MSLFKKFTSPTPQNIRTLQVACTLIAGICTSLIAVDADISAWVTYTGAIAGYLATFLMQFTRKKDEN